MATGTIIITGATATGGSIGTRNGSRSFTRIGSHGMTTGKITITDMVIEPIQDRNTGRFGRAMKTGAQNSPEAPAVAREETQKVHVL